MTMKLEAIKEVVRIKQVVTEALHERFTIRSPQDGAELATQYIGDDDREVFLVIALSSKNHVNAIHRCHIGALNSAIVTPREVFKAAILNNSASIVCAHQHPSNDPRESREDVLITERLVEAGKILGIEVLDHLIVTNDPNKFVSLKEKGCL